MIGVNDRGRLKPEKGILDFKKIMALMAGLIVNNEKVASPNKTECTTFQQG